ncbi:MAG: hypothetical protein F6J93_33550 [Oscillatoria sp. SIO1A7]|nr:hypothetical protein [Oscillatoria sp. SIO1A7]
MNLNNYSESRVNKIRGAIEAQLLDYWQQLYNEYIEDGDADAEIWEEREIEAEQLADKPQTAYQFYRETVEMEDWGSVRAYRTELEGEAIDIIYVVTDGDDGWLEAYDAQGNLIGAARRYIELLAWGNVEDLRGQVKTLEFPAELDKNATLWQEEE